MSVGAEFDKATESALWESHQSPIHHEFSVTNPDMCSSLMRSQMAMHMPHQELHCSGVAPGLRVHSDDVLED